MTGRTGQDGAAEQATPTRRVPRLAPDQLDAEQRALHETLTSGPRAGSPELVDALGRLRGPFDLMLRSPAVGGPLQALGAALRYRGVLPDGAREVAVLVVAAAEHSAFEATAHAAVARRAGVAEPAVRALAEGHTPELTDPVERVVHEAAVALVTTGTVDRPLFDRAVSLVGEAGLFDLVSLVGYYRLLAAQLRVFGADGDPVRDDLADG